MTRLFWSQILQNYLLFSSRRCSFVAGKTAKVTKLLCGYTHPVYKTISVKMDSDRDLCFDAMFDGTRRGLRFGDNSVLIAESENLNIDSDSETLPPLVDQCCKVTANTVLDDRPETTNHEAKRKRLASTGDLDRDDENPRSAKINENDALQNEEGQSEVKNVKPWRKRKNKKMRNRKVENESGSDDVKLHSKVNDDGIKNEKVEKTKPTEIKKYKNVENESGEDEMIDSKVKPPKKPRPNYFIAVRVCNPAIHSSIKVIQDSLISKEPLLQSALIPLGTLHLTLMVMHLKIEQLQQAVDVLHSCENDLKKLFEDNHTFDISFEGLGHFRNEVVFGKISGENEVAMLRSLASVIREGYESNEIVPQKDDRPLEPHLTIMKLSRMPKRKKTKKIKKIPQDTYSAWIDCELGQETISEVLLCSMVDKKEEDGFYHSVGSVDISGSAVEKNTLHSFPGLDKQDENCTTTPELQTSVEMEGKTKDESSVNDGLTTTPEFIQTSAEMEEKTKVESSVNDGINTSDETEDIMKISGGN